MLAFFLMRKTDPIKFKKKKKKKKKILKMQETEHYVGKKLTKNK